MPKFAAFAHYLMGHSPFDRTPFFYAYVGMWLHLPVGTGLLGFAAACDWLSALATSVVASFCLGLVLYGVLTKRPVLLINIGAYAASIARAFSADAVVLTCFIAGLIAAFVSGYSLLAAEYARYQRAISRPPAPLPAAAALLLGAAIVLLGAYGLWAR